MRKRILKKLLLGSFLVLFITFLITGTFLFGVLVNNALHDREQMLRRNINRISDLTSVALTHESTPLTTMYRSMVDGISDNTGASIIVFDGKGTILTVSGLSKPEFVGKTLRPELSEAILRGEKLSHTGMLNGLYQETVLTVGGPMRENGKIFGGVIMNLPVPEINKMYWDLFQKMGLTVIIAVVISSALFYHISRRITTPIKKINNAVTAFSKGHFEKRVEYISNDEIGELALNFNNMADSLENLEKMRSSFVANVSHELRTPMTTIGGFIEGILDGTIAEEEQAKYLEIVLSETKRLSRLVNDLLKLARMESGETELNKRVFNINELVKQVLFKFEMEIEEKHIDIALDLDKEQCDVYADSDSITQVLTNLLHNAVKFTPNEGKITLRVWTAGAKAMVQVCDTGMGIEPEKLPYIWDRFYKADSSRSHDKKGMGLGLFIVKNIIHSHQEDIRVESTPGEGTTFTFSLARA